MRTTLYRAFDGAGDLLYVGISLRPLRRLAEHSKSAPWSHLVARIDLENFNSRADALAAERRAILRERPLRNIAHSSLKATPGAALLAMRLADLGLDQRTLRAHLGLSAAAISLKLNGHRPWFRDEIDAVLALAREKDPAVTYELLFAGGEPVADDEQPIEAAS